MNMTLDSHALARQMLEQHADLDRRIDQLVAEVKGDIDWDHVDVSLEVLGRSLVAHFKLEEEGGYMADVRAREPREIPIIDKLRREHATLWKELLKIRRVVEARTSDTRLRGMLDRWLAHLRRHERDENRLVQEAYNLDLGARD